MQNRRYPKLQIRSKNELAKHISHEGFSKENALVLINDVLVNSDLYWKDSKSSEPKKGKYIRNASRTKLGLLLQKINTMVLAPHDKILPKFIFGGIKEMNHVKAAKHLLGNKRRRILLKMDLKSFFEQIDSNRVSSFFEKKCECDKRAAKLLSNFCCVPIGAKGNVTLEKSIARGFATSSRLAVWCNLDILIKLERFVQKKLTGYDPRIAIYVDDIGITASRVPKEKMEKLREEIKEFLLTTDKNQQLKINENKTKIISHEQGMEYVGALLQRNSLRTGNKSRSKRDKIKDELDKATTPSEKSRLKRKYKSMSNYKRYIEKA